MSNGGNGYRAVFAHRSFRNYWMGFSLSYLGDTISRVALTWFVYETTHSPGGIEIIQYFFRWSTTRP